MGDFQIHPLIIIWVAILLLIFIVMFFNFLSKRSKYRMIERLAERGQALTPEILSGIANGHSRSERGPIASGIFMICIGVALMLFFWALEGGGMPMTNGNWLWVIGIFPFMIGVARLLGAVFDKRGKE